MKLNNINFGARIDKGTYQTLLEARRKGLNTQEAETLMTKVCPAGTIYTTSVNNTLDGRINKGIKSMIIYSNFINSGIEILPVKILSAGSIDYIGKAYKINQKTIDLITKRLKKLTANSIGYKFNIKTKDEYELMKKFGDVN